MAIEHLRREPLHWKRILLVGTFLLLPFWLMRAQICLLDFNLLCSILRNNISLNFKAAPTAAAWSFAVCAWLVLCACCFVPVLGLCLALGVWCFAMCAWCLVGQFYRGLSPGGSTLWVSATATPCRP